MRDNESTLGFAFFRAESGKEPVKEWLKKLSPEEKLKVGKALRRAQKCWPLGMPVVRPMGKGLYEVRVSLGQRIARVLFMVFENDIVALHAFIKKTQQTPDADLELARKRAKQLSRG